jgi:hypothetical protein
MNLLVSAQSVDEARVLIDASVDIIDVKNPAEGSLGAQPPQVVRDIAEYASSRGVPVSAALGDLPFQPGTAALAAFGLANVGVDYVKAGLHGTHTRSQAIELLRAVREAVRMANESVAVVAVGYADYQRFDGLAPEHLVNAAAQTGCSFVMLDTAIKDGRSLFDALCLAEIEAFIAAGRRGGLQVALAGSLNMAHLPALRTLGPNIVGVRGAVCGANGRRGGIDPVKARRFVQAARGSEAAEALHNNS